jgi:class 3 adenylate cyclase
LWNFVDSALEAVQSGVEIQRSLHERNKSNPPDRHILLRIGLHLGDVVHSGAHVQGDGVNIAARLEPLAKLGGICLSEDVARQIRNKIDFPLIRVGKKQLKNIELPISIRDKAVYAPCATRYCSAPAFDRTARWRHKPQADTDLRSGRLWQDHTPG